MLQAHVSSVFRSFAIAGVLVALSVVGAGAAKSSRHSGHLVLHAVAQPNAIYLSIFGQGDDAVPFDGKLGTRTFTTTVWAPDDCQWRSTERLVPAGERRYRYSYDETLLRCHAGATPYVKTPRLGIVTLED